MADETLQLQLGDIIQIEAPTNESLDEEIFLIEYIDSKQIEIANIKSLKKTRLLLDENGELDDESIDSISILSRDKESGYARQNGFLPKTWVKLTFSGELPAIISGEITNLEEDMIEIMTFPEKETIYIDFAYRGMPKDIPLKSIEIRDPPDLEILGDVPREDVEGKTAPFQDVPVPEIKKTIQKIIIQADEIAFGPDLGEISQEVAIDESYERYGLQTQTNDLLDELLATIPNAKRNTAVLNRIHLMIERFKELRSLFSVKDEYGNPIEPIVKGAGYKPLVERLKSFSQSLNWIIPVVKNKRKIYMDEMEEEADMVDDIVPMTMAEGQIQDTDALAQYRNNSIPDSQNKYDYLLKTIQEIGTPYEAPDSDGTDIITKQDVQSNLDVIVDNLDDFYSSIVSRDSINRKRYLVNKYNLGFNKLKTIVEPGSKPYNKLVKGTPGNKLFLKSFILMPEETIRQSRVSLPGSSILVKSNLNLERKPFYKRFTKTANINSQIIESFDAPVEPIFLDAATEMVLDDGLQDEPDKYEKYLQSIIPRTKTIFRIVKKYIDEKLTLSEVVKEMEPFLIYSDDLTYKQYSEITKFVRDKVNEYKKNYVASSRDFRALQSGKRFAERTWYSIFNILTREKKEVMENGYGLKMKGFSSSENYHRIMDIDSGRLFMTAVAMENMMLMTPVDINDIFQREKLRIDDATVDEKNDCGSYTLVKRYLELDELLDDNGKTIYVDKNLDQTRYDIIKEYDNEKQTMGTEEFEDFLKETLIKNIGLSQENAAKDARAMIDGKRMVEDGDYASLEIDGGEKTYYYRRTDGQWERDESFPDVSMSESEFCNIRKPCIKVKDDCDTNAIADEKRERTTLDSMINEFNIKYEVSKEELSRLIQNRFAFFTYRMKILKKLRFDEKTRYSDRALMIGMDTEENDDIIISPYVKLRDAILGQPDLVKRNTDIVRFQKNFTRDPSEDSNEDAHWLYCKETNQKLLPVFIVTLASTFNENQYNYVRVLDQICASQGKLSDDGNAWVDKHSGYVIKQVAFDTEEGYDESGFKAVSREVMQEELGAVRSDELKRKFNDPNAEKISNVIQAMASYMGFSVEPMQEFVIRNTLLITSKLVPSEKEHNRKRDALAKKGKKVPSYSDLYNTSMMIITFVFLLVGIQASVPSIKTRKQFPGCKKSFDGFPLDGSGDDSAIQYIACVANSIKSGVSPWGVLKKMKATGIAKRMKDIINKYVVPDSAIQTLFNEKRNYMITEKGNDVPVELDIARWNTFLPPLVAITTHGEDINEYTKELVKHIESGKYVSNIQISKLKSGMIHYPMVLVEEIQKVIQKEMPLLTNISQEAFLENACCIDEDEETTINYFIKRVPSLGKINSIMKKLHTIYRDISDITVAPRIFSSVNTRRIYPALSSAFSKKTIYRALIEHCRFGTLFPIPDNLLQVCIKKPDDFSLLDSLKTQIEKLEMEGINFSLEHLNRLLQTVNRENTITVSLYDDETSSMEKLRAYLSDDTIAIPEKLHQLLKDITDTFDINVSEPTPEMKKLINYVDKEINDLKASIIIFLQKNSKLTTRKFNSIVELLRKMTLVDDEGSETTDFIKNIMYQLTQVFPNMVINNVDYEEITFPPHWRSSLSERHIADIYNIIHSYYKGLTRFNENDVLCKMLEHITSKTQMWRDFVDVLPVFERIEKNGGVPSINTSMVSMLAQYSLLQCIGIFIAQVDETGLVGVAPGPGEQDDSALEITTLNEIIDEEIGNISEIDIVSGEKLQRSETMASFLLETITIFGNTKRLVDYTYKDVIYRVNVSKEKEKDQFTKRLKELTDEEREIENIMKKHKLGVWSKGLSKGVTQYEQDTYDEERREMEKIIALEQKVGSQDFVSDMNRDIFMSEAAEAARVDAMIDAEESRIEYMGEDADYEEMGMDGDEMY